MRNGRDCTIPTPAPGGARRRGDPGAAQPRRGGGYRARCRGPDAGADRVGGGRRRRDPVRAPRVVLQDVTVRFPGRSSPALAGVRILIPPRTVLGVTGRSGTGKSTLLRVARGWLRPTEGRALTDGVPAADGSHAQLIGQHPYLFSGTLADNIALGQPGASRSRIWAAIEAAQLTSLLGRLPDGLDTVLGERGWSISAGRPSGWPWWPATRTRCSGSPAA
jgi:ABC-type multidrug transport system fused ATPase/permease subunit